MYCRHILGCRRRMGVVRQMILETDSQQRINNPTDETITSAIQSMLGDEDREDFIVLMASDSENCFMQTVLDGEDTFTVEYRVGERHYMAERVSTLTTIELFRYYLHE